MCMNSASMFGTETVRVRPVNCYGPHEEYSPYKGFIPIFIYKLCITIPTQYIKDINVLLTMWGYCFTFANIVDNFILAKYTM